MNEMILVLGSLAFFGAKFFACVAEAKTKKAIKWIIDLHYNYTKIIKPLKKRMQFFWLKKNLIKNHPSTVKKM